MAFTRTIGRTSSIRPFTTLESTRRRNEQPRSVPAYCVSVVAEVVLAQIQHVVKTERGNVPVGKPG